MNSNLRWAIVASGAGGLLLAQALVTAPAAAYQRRFHAQFCATNTDHPGDYRIHGWDMNPGLRNGRIENVSGWHAEYAWRDRLLMCPVIDDHQLPHTGITDAVVHVYDDSELHEVKVWGCVTDYFGFWTYCGETTYSSDALGNNASDVGYRDLSAIPVDISAFQLTSGTAPDGWPWERSYAEILISIPNGEHNELGVENETLIVGYTVCDTSDPACGLVP